MSYSKALSYWLRTQSVLVNKSKCQLNFMLGILGLALSLTKKFLVSRHQHQKTNRDGKVYSIAFIFISVTRRRRVSDILGMHPQHAKLDTFVFSTQINATRYLCVPGKLKNKMDYAYIFGYTKLKIGFS